MIVVYKNIEAGKYVFLCFYIFIYFLLFFLLWCNRSGRIVL